MTVYRIIYRIVRWLLQEYVREDNHTKLSRSIAAKNNGKHKGDLKIVNPIWIHAASGEIEYARPVIREIKKQFPEVKIMVTYSSISAEKILADIPEIDLSLAIPWDTPSDCQKFLGQFKPRMALFARTDVWPEMSYQLSLAKIPSLLFSATFAKNSSRLRFPGSLFTRIALENLQTLYCVSFNDLENLQNILTHADMQALGDTRFDQAFYRLENPKKIKDSLFAHIQDKVFIFGSTWEEDEQVLLPAMKDLKGFRFMIAPHETGQKHLAILEKHLSALGFTIQKYSTAESWTSQVLIIDQVGILAELYQYADIAFVGGSFKKQVHSVMEPLAAGLPVLVGPYFQNNREAIEFSTDQQFVLSIHTSAELSEAALTALSSPTKSKHNIRTKLQQKTGASKCVVSWVQRHL